MERHSHAGNLQKKELPVSVAAMNPITVATDMPCDPTSLVPICMRSNDQSIDELYVQLLSPPDARTVLLPKSDNCCANTPAIPIMVVLISLQFIKEELLEDRQDSVLICLRN